MELALIPPKAYIKETAKTHYQLALPSFAEDSEYVEWYRFLSGRKDYIILDNGVAEGQNIDFLTLLTVASNIGAREVILPDVMEDSAATLGAIGSIAHLARHHDRFNYMAVVQGRSFIECWDFILRAVHNHAFITTLGLPRHLITTTQNRWIRFELALKIHTQLYSPYDIHFLGNNRAFQMEALRLKESGLNKIVRGMDTSLPFVYGIEGLNLGNPLQHVDRQEDYYNLTGDAKQIEENVQEMLGWVYD